MSPSVDQMRDKVVQVYPGPKWKYRVERMRDSQIIAIYHKFSQEGKFDKIKPNSNTESSHYQARQLVMEDFLNR